MLPILGERTASGLAIDTVQRMMADRVTIWANDQHVKRLARETHARLMVQRRADGHRAATLTRNAQAAAVKAGR